MKIEVIIRIILEIILTVIIWKFYWAIGLFVFLTTLRFELEDNLPNN